MKWYLHNAAQRLRFAVKAPRYALKTAFRELTMADERFLASATGGSALQIRGFLQEPSATPKFLAHLRASEGAFKEGMSSADLWAKKILVQYAAVRALQPDLIVETGVASGVSTSHLLLALEKNQKGTLHSVEIGDSTYLPAGKEPGWIVPEWLKSRWQLHIGDVKAVLPGLLQDLGQVDIFIHDSLHTYEHMKYEFELAYPHVRRGGMIFADDALWNPSFPEFAQAVHAPLSAIIRGVGFLKT